MRIKTCIRPSSRTFRAAGLLSLALLVSGCGARSDSPAAIEAALAQVATNMKDGDLSAAVISLRGMAKRLPSQAEVRRRLGLAYLEQGDWAGAEKELSKAAELQPGKRRDEIALVEAGIFGARFDKVPERLARLEQHDAGAIKALRGLYEIVHDRTEAATKRFSEIAKAEPDNVWVLFGSAKIALAERRFAGAREVLSRYIDLKPLNVPARVMDGEAKLGMGETSAARTSFDRALALNPQALPARLGRVKSYLVEGTLDQAASELLKARAPNSDDAILDYFDGVIKYRQKKSEPAIDSFRKALKKAPAHLSSQYFLAVLMLETGRSEQAEEYASLVVTALPDFLPARKLLATVQLYRRNPKKALETLAVGVEGVDGESDKDLLALRAEAQFSAGEVDKGLATLQHAVDSNPKDIRLKNVLVQAQMSAGYTDDAIALLEQDIDAGDATPQSRLLLVYSFLKKASYDDAIKAAREGLTTNVDAPSLWNALGLAYANKGQIPEAREAFEIAVKKAPESRSIARNLIRLEILAKDFDRASHRLEALVTDSPDNAATLQLAGELSAGIGNAEKSLAYFEKTRKADSQNIISRIHLANHYFAKREYRKAAEVSAEAVKIAPTNVSALVILGHSLRALGEAADAANVTEVLLDLSPKSAAAHLLMGLIKSDQRHMDDAENHLQLAQKLEPNNQELLYARATVALAKGDIAAATKLSEQFGSRAKTDWRSRSLDGDIASAQGNYEIARQKYQAAWSEAPSEEIAAKLNYALARSGHTQDAITGIGSALTSYPENEKLLILLAQTLSDSGDAERAIATYREALLKHPKSVVALNNLASLIYFKDPKEALKFSEQAVQLAPEDPNVLDTHGWILLTTDIDNSSLNKGLQIIEKAAKMAPSDGEIRYHLAVALAKANDNKRAAKEAKFALTLPSLISKKEAAELAKHLGR